MLKQLGMTLARLDSLEEDIEWPKSPWQSPQQEQHLNDSSGCDDSAGASARLD